MTKQLETTVIPTKRQVIYDTYANFPTAGLEKGDLAWATDRKCLYRWSGSAWETIGISSRHGDYADIGNPADYPESSLYQADDQDKLYMVVSGIWKAIVVPASVIDIEVSDDIVHSNDTERSNACGSYTKIKEIKVNEAFDDVMRIKFDLHCEYGGFTVKAKLYKNGSPIGTERETTSQSYVTFSEDFDLDLAADDLLQIYAYSNNEEHYHFVRNFRLCDRGKVIELSGDTLITDLYVAPALSATNQDP